MPDAHVIVAFAAADPWSLARFWAGLLDREPVAGVLLPGSATAPSLRFLASDGPDAGPNRLHLHLTSADAADQEATVALARSLGAEPLDVGQRPEEGHVVLADPEGNAFCVIEPGNRYLAGCGRFGEVTCEGGRAVGLLWSAMTGWPLVWDEGEQTAVQSPRGGTKVSWDGEGMASGEGRGRLRLELAASAGPVERLVALGAVVLRTEPDGTVVLADPDGGELGLAPALPPA